MAQTPEQPVSQRDLIKLLSVLTELGLDVIKIENLFSFNGERGFALGQGQ
jgi:isocitrate dehydrogenase